MSIVTPEIFSLYGCMDSDAFADGAAVSAHHLRTLALARNRLLAKAQPLCNLVWPTSYTNELQVDSFEGVGALAWQRVHPQILVAPKMGLRLMDARLRVKVTSGAKIAIQIETRAAPFRDTISSGANYLEISGSGSYDDVSLSNVPIADDGYDYLNLWIRGSPTGTLGVTGTYGSPNRGTHDVLERGAMTDNAATWNSAIGASTWAEGGHYVRFENSAAAVLPIAPRTISTMVGGTRITFWPELIDQEIHTTQVTNQNYYAIMQLPRWAIANFAAAAVARTI